MLFLIEYRLNKRMWIHFECLRKFLRLDKSQYSDYSGNSLFAIDNTVPWNLSDSYKRIHLWCSHKSSCFGKS